MTQPIVNSANELLASSFALRRRTFLTLAVGILISPWEIIRAEEIGYPSSVAGIVLPHTHLAVKAFALCKSKAPEFLVNHSLRTYVFGALHAAHHRQFFDGETAFVAAVLHDLGLLPAYASKAASFEIDGADAAETFARTQGASPAEATNVWNAIVMHDMRFAIPSHQSPEATLVAAGAAADVVGPDDDMIDPATVREVVGAFPRLQFKRDFSALLLDHCTRKPGAQTGTWLEGFCREHGAGTPASGTEDAIRQAPFNE